MYHQSLADRFAKPLLIVISLLAICSLIGMIRSCYNTVTHVEAIVNDKVHDVERWTDKDGHRHKDESFYIRTDKGKYGINEDVYGRVTTGKTYRLTIRGWKGFQIVVDAQQLREFDPAVDVKVE